MDDYVEVYRDTAGDLRWRYRDGSNGLMQADGGQGYADMRDLTKAIGKVTGRTPTIVETKGAPLPGAGSIRVVVLRG